MFHQKNKSRGRHKYCKTCRASERLRITERKRERRAKAKEEWIIARPISLEDFIPGESMKDMKKRIGVAIHRISIDAKPNGR